MHYAAEGTRLWYGFYGATLESDAVRTKAAFSRAVFSPNTLICQDRLGTRMRRAEAAGVSAGFSVESERTHEGDWQPVRKRLLCQAVFDETLPFAKTGSGQM